MAEAPEAPTVAEGSSPVDMPWIERDSAAGDAREQGGSENRGVANSPESSRDSASQPAQTSAGQGARKPVSDGNIVAGELKIERPPEGETVVIEANGLPVSFDFPMSESSIAVSDVDMVLSFPDGGKIVLPGYILDLLGTNANEVKFTDTVLNPQTLLARVDEIKLSNEPMIGSGPGSDGVRSDNNGKQDSDDMPRGVPPSPTSKLMNVADFVKNFDEVLPNPTTPSAAERPMDSGGPVKPDSVFASGGGGGSNNNTGDGTVLAAKLQITLFGVSGDQAANLPSGGKEILGAPANSAASTNSAFDVQQAPRVINGTANDDVIYIYNPTDMPAGTTARLIDIKATLPSAGVVADTAIVTNLPTGYAINNATRDGTNWVVDLNPADPNHLQLELRYVLPTAGAEPDASGYYGKFNLNVVFGVTKTDGSIQYYSGSQTFALNDVHEQSDATIVSPTMARKPRSTAGRATPTCWWWRRAA